jgi:hypothetical protein
MLFRGRCELSIFYTPTTRVPAAQTRTMLGFLRSGSSASPRQLRSRVEGCALPRAADDIKVRAKSASFRHGGGSMSRGRPVDVAVTPVFFALLNVDEGTLAHHISEAQYP